MCLCVSSNEGQKVPWLDATSVCVSMQNVLLGISVCTGQRLCNIYIEMSLIHSLSASVSICLSVGTFPP